MLMKWQWLNYLLKIFDILCFLGLFSKEEIDTEQGKRDNGILQPIAEGQFTLEDLEGEVLQFPTNCHGCGSPCETNMKMTSILYKCGN